MIRNITKEDLHRSGIYKITNIVNGDFYIGGTTNFGRRFAEHNRSTRNQVTKSCTELIEASKIHGPDSLLFEIVEYCTPELLHEREDYYIATLDPPYNLYLGWNAKRGMRDVVKKRMSVSQTGRKETDAHKAAISRGHMGLVPSQETKDKIRERRHEQVMKKPSEETRAKMRNSARRGKDSNFPTRRILDNSNGHIFETLTDAAKEYGYKMSTLCAMLNGQNSNRTTLAYA